MSAAELVCTGVTTSHGELTSSSRRGTDVELAVVAGAASTSLRARVGGPASSTSSVGESTFCGEQLPDVVDPATTSSLTDDSDVERRPLTVQSTTSSAASSANPASLGPSLASESIKAFSRQARPTLVSA